MNDGRQTLREVLGAVSAVGLLAAGCGGLYGGFLGLQRNDFYQHPGAALCFAAAALAFGLLAFALRPR